MFRLLIGNLHQKRSIEFLVIENVEDIILMLLLTILLLDIIEIYTNICPLDVYFGLLKLQT